MTLNEFTASNRLSLLEELRAGKDPSVGLFDASNLRVARTKGTPQLGTTRYEPHAVVVEIIFPSAHSNSTVFEVRIPTPERVVYLAVPVWVVEQIWEGEVDGTYHFETDARALVATFISGLEEEVNSLQFGPKEPKRRG